MREFQYMGDAKIKMLLNEANWVDKVTVKNDVGRRILRWVVDMPLLEWLGIIQSAVKGTLRVFLGQILTMRK